MKTTKKEFKEQVQKHIINNLNEEYGYGIDEQLDAVAKGFKDWYGPHEQKMKPNRQEAFKSWLMGLPSQMDIEYTDHGANETMKSWFENCGAEYKEPKESFDLYLNLVYRELNTLFKRNNTQF